MLRLFFSIILMVGLLACHQNPDQSSLADSQVAMIDELKSQLPKQSVYHISVSENIGKTPCPKLLPIDTHRPITHYHDKMMSDSCDYYLYPKVGQFLYVGSSSPTISAKLISPITHDFRLGAVEVHETGRYVVRLTRSYHFGMSDVSLLHSLKVVVSNDKPNHHELSNQ